MALFFLVVITVFLAENCDSAKIFGGYFPNWSQYRVSPYNFTPEHLQGIIGRFDQLIYTRAYFDDVDYRVKYTDPKDEIFIQEIMKYKLIHPQLKVLISIGGDNFPSYNFSNMVSSDKSRALFINSLQIFLRVNKFDGIDINWKWPCSVQRILYHPSKRNRLTCDGYIKYVDKGSSCPQDAHNFLSLLKEMRQTLGNYILIAITSTPVPQEAKNLPLVEYSNYIDYWYIESYGYAVSSTNNSSTTAPYAPLNQLPSAPQSINNTVSAYLEAGVPANKIIIGIPLHGNVWYVPNIDGTKWQEFGAQASIQGKCCGPYSQTFGGKYGPGSQQCGTYMYSEISAVSDMEYYYDKVTQTAIGYVKRDSIDGWTEGGTWFSYNDKNSVQAITNFIKESNLRGAFVSDVSEDTIDFSNKEFTYEIMEAVYSGLQGGGGNICNPAVGCNVCPACCRTYLTNQFDCDACVTIKCSINECYPPSDCNVCTTCCSDFIISEAQCNLCVKSKCKKL